MKLDTFVLILVAVIAAAGLTIALVAGLVAPAGPAGWAVVIPVVLVIAILWRVIADRLGNSEDDHYDRIEK